MPSKKFCRATILAVQLVFVEVNSTPFESKLTNTEALHILAWQDSHSPFNGLSTRCLAWIKLCQRFAQAEPKVNLKIQLQEVTI